MLKSAYLDFQKGFNKQVWLFELYKMEDNSYILIDVEEL